jgi:hypothetical protein
MADNVLMQDTLEVYLKDLDAGTAYFFGLTTEGEINQKIKQEMLKAGIGNKVVATVNSDKEMTFKVTTLFSNDSIIAMQVGKAMASGTATVQKSETLALSSGKLNLTGTVKTGTTSCLVIDAQGKTYTNTIATNVVTVTSGVEGALYTAIYPTDVTGTILDLDSESFPKNYAVELHTIGYNPDTNKVLVDIYWQFAKAIPNGSLQKAYKAGQSTGDDIEFTAQTPANSKSYGKYISIPRA